MKLEPIKEQILASGKDVSHLLPTHKKNTVDKKYIEQITAAFNEQFS